MVKRINIAVFFGGRSGEHEVSLMSARSVLSVLDPEKYNVIQVGITHEGKWVAGQNVIEKLENGETEGLDQITLLPYPGQKWLYTVRPAAGGQIMEPFAQIDVAFPVLHGTFGEDGTVQGFFELAELAYVGAGVLGSSVGMDKALFKDVMRAQGIPVLESMTFTRFQVEKETANILPQLEKIAPYPLFTKPSNLGSSVGITKCRNRSDLIEGLMEAARYDRRVLIERGLNRPREIEISVLGNDHPQASVPGEVVPSDEFYSYRAKYLDGTSKLLIPARLDRQTSEKMRSLAEKVFKAVDCSGMARVDFLVDRATSDFFVSEINTIPGFTSISMYPKLWEASGISYQALIDRLVELSLERKSERDATERKFGRNE